MKIAVVGAGGVGGYIAAMLARAGEDICVVARGTHKEAIEREGITVRVGGETLPPVRVSVTDDPAKLSEKFDVVLFCVKGYDLESAALSMKEVIGKNTLLLPLGNGVGNDEVLKRIYPENPVANGAVYIVSRIVKPGFIEVKGRGAFIVMGMEGASHPALNELADALGKAGIKTKVSDRIKTDLWRKFLLISAMATLTTCYDEPMGAVMAEHPEEFDRILHEILEVGRAEGAKLSEEDIDSVKEQLKKVPYDSPTSMWLDFKAGRESELEQLSGYVVKKAAEHSIEVPLMKRCYGELKRR